MPYVEFNFGGEYDSLAVLQTVLSALFEGPDRMLDGTVGDAAFWVSNGWERCEARRGWQPRVRAMLQVRIRQDIAGALGCSALHHYMSRARSIAVMHNKQEIVMWNGCTISVLNVLAGVLSNTADGPHRQRFATKSYCQVQQPPPAPKPQQARPSTAEPALPSFD